MFVLLDLSKRCPCHGSAVLGVGQPADILLILDPAATGICVGTQGYATYAHDLD